ncbi:MAG: 30S ribosome-binding factor RbfA [Spirochaetia bacterium]|nr:30S ribosome-binding factor RbfA [Spirochaetia bacterium]
MINHVHERLAQRIQEAIGMMIVTKEIKHPLLSPFVSVSEVILSKDKAYATVYITSFVEDAQLIKSVDALQHSAGYIQSRLGKILTTRNTPQLTFKVDNSIAEQKRMSDLIDSLDT